MASIIATIIIIFLVVLLWYCFNFNEIEEILEYRKEKKVKEIILNDENTNNLSENLVINNILDKLKKIQTDIDELKLCKNVEDCKDDTRYN